MKRRNFLTLLPALAVLQTLPFRKSLQIRAAAEVIGGTYQIRFCGQTIGPFRYDVTSEEINEATKGSSLEGIIFEVKQ